VTPFTTPHIGSPCPWTWSTSTPTASSGALPEEAAFGRLRELPLPMTCARRIRPSCSTARSTRAPRSWSPPRTSAAARRGGRRVGPRGRGLPRVDRALVRRHLLRELLQERRARDRAAPGNVARCARHSRRSPAPGSPSTFPRRPCRCPAGAWRLRDRSPSGRNACSPESTRSS
jgi:hypothetical protein